MLTRKLELVCPVCGSREVFYSCTPNCCFNHVCNACGATFEPATSRKSGAGKLAGAIMPPDPLPDATDPTAECAACHATAVYMTQDGGVLCGQCGAWLEVEYTEVASG